MPPLVSKMVGVRIQRGQKVRLETPGGGGYGNALSRDPQAVARDVRLGFVGVESARKDYGVELDADGNPDTEKTRTLRAGAAR